MFLSDILCFSCWIFRSTNNQTRIFVLILVEVLAAVFEAILEDSVWHKIPKKLEYNVTG